MRRPPTTADEGQRRPKTATRVTTASQRRLRRPTRADLPPRVLEPHHAFPSPHSRTLPRVLKFHHPFMTPQQAFTIPRLGLVYVSWNFFFFAHYNDTDVFIPQPPLPQPQQDDNHLTINQRNVFIPQRSTTTSTTTVNPVME